MFGIDHVHIPVCDDRAGIAVHTAFVQAGDLLCVFATGAYNYSMASNYNRLPRPPIVMVRDGKDRLLVKRESYEQLVQNDM